MTRREALAAAAIPIGTIVAGSVEGAVGVSFVAAKYPLLVKVHVPVLPQAAMESLREQLKAAFVGSPWDGVRAVLLPPGYDIDVIEDTREL